MKFKSKENDVSQEKITTSDGKTIIKDYVIYDSAQDGYLDSTKYWGSHYIELIYDSDDNLISKTLKENDIGEKTADAQAEFYNKYLL